jgi:hypothetical protein
LKRCFRSRAPSTTRDAIRSTYKIAEGVGDLGKGWRLAVVGGIWVGDMAKEEGDGDAESFSRW